MKKYLMKIFIVRNAAITFLYSSLLIVLTCVLTVNTGYAIEAGAPTVRFAVIGDYGDASTGVAEVADLVDSWGADFIITVGDNRYGTRNFDETVGQFYCAYLSDAGIGIFCPGGSSVKNDFYPSPGNHDYLNPDGLNEYLDYFTLPGSDDVSSWTSGSERYYDFIRGTVHFFVLDSQGALDNVLDETAQKNWLENALAQSTAPWQIVYFHHAPYASGINNGSTASMRWPFAAWGADAVISGHDHIYERIYANGITYFISGLGGTSAYDIGPPIPVSQASYNSEFGALLVDATNDDISFRFIDTLGTVIDTHTISEPSSPGVIDVWIENSLDDVEQQLPDGTMYVDSSDIELGDDPQTWEEQAEGLRFRNVSIPQGASISEAYLEFVVDETGDTATVVEIRAQDIGDAPAFSTVNFDLTDRITTSNFVIWDIPAWDIVHEIHQSPDLTALIQEVVDRSDWQANNSMAFIITGTGTRTAEAWDGDQGLVPLLHVEFSTSQCNPTGIPETICNGIDDDCDGSIDEEFQITPTTCGVGECTATGQTTCVDGTPGDTCTPGASSAEVCDNLDNDCDGSIDENLSRTTTCGVGECGATGQETCTAGTWGSDTCTPGTPSAEICDNLDNDCDGSTDENLTRPTTCGVGECGATGQETCTAGTWGNDTCTTGTPSSEVCDNLDNDCDGTVDEGDVCHPGAIEDILAEFDESVLAGTLNGESKNHKKSKKHEKSDKRLTFMRSFLLKIGKHIEKNETEEACSKLKHLDMRSDGSRKPKNIIVGEAVPKLNSMLKQLMDNLGCN